MKDSRNIAIVVLTISAAILGAMLVASTGTPPAWGQAVAPSVTPQDYWEWIEGSPAPTSAVAGLTSRYNIATGPCSASQDLLYILDSQAGRLNAYLVNSQTGMVDIVESVDLKKGFQD
jgi:hypothetical protein